MKKVIVAMSDTHGGHRLGLMNPEVKLFDEDENGNLKFRSPDLTATQRYLWRLYLDDIEQVKKIAKGKKIILLHNGDLCQGDKYVNQWVSTRQSDQITIAVSNFAPWLKLKNLDKIRLVHGTGAHGFGEGSAESLVSEQLLAKSPKLNISQLTHSLADIDGLTIDYAHHGPGTGGRQWLEGNIARYSLKSIINYEVAVGNEPPDIVLRGHYHNFIWETIRRGTNGSMKEHHIFVLPSYCGMGEHGRQATKSKCILSNGLVVFEVDNGKLIKVHPIIHTTDLRRKESL
jgi:hypothetical protein